MKQAMIFAAGLGTRLKPLTDTMPKALVPVGGEPLLRHVVLRLKEAGFERIVVNVHHFADQIINYLRANQHFGLDIRISDERDQLLDTGGGIRKAASLFDADSPILIHNVDILSNIDLAALYDKAQQTDALLLVSQRKTQRYLLFDEAKRLVGWTNVATQAVKSPYPDLEVAKYQMLAFSGIHVLHPSMFSQMEGWQEKFGIIDFYLQQCDRSKVMGYEQPDLRLLDVGKLDSLTEAETFLSHS